MKRLKAAADKTSTYNLRSLLRILKYDFVSSRLVPFRIERAGSRRYKRTTLSPFCT